MTFPIPYNFKPRDYQLDILAKLDKGYKRVLWIVHRRAGKDITCLNYIIKRMVEDPGVYFYIFPTYAQAKKVIWDSIRNDGFRILDHFPKLLVESMNSQEMKIRFTNGSLFQLVGSDNYDSLMGTNPKGVVFSEYALQDPRAYEFIRPILTGNGGFAIFISTPRGKNHLWDLYQLVKNNPEWWVQILSVNETKAITLEDIERDRKEGMSEELIQQEYFCSFDRGVEGSYYGKILALLREKCQIKSVPYDSYALVHTAWDIGFGDSTAIWFYQMIDNEVHLIDYYESHGEGLSHYIKVLEKKRVENDWMYSQHYFPHDAQAGSFELGMSKVKYAFELGLKVQVLPREGLDHGIERVRKWLPRCYFDEKKCKVGIKALENYQKTYNDKLKVYSDTPLHNWASHCFTGDTKILTRYGMQQIMDLPKNGEVLTLCGWKKYQNPRVTRVNAPLVEVMFKDGYTVKCTPDHLFLTEKGWKSAESLMKDFQIQSTLTQLPNTLMADCIGYGQKKDILHAVVKHYIEKFGKLPLVKFLRDVIFTIKMETHLIINYLTSNAFKKKNILVELGMKQNTNESMVFQRRQEEKLQNGINLKKGGCGIEDTLKDQKDGRNGNEKKDNVYAVKTYFNVLSEKMDINKNIAQIDVKPLTIESVKHLEFTEDVWCLTVPEVEHFSLGNGAVVHNCADSFRYLCMALETYQTGSKMSSEQYQDLKRKHSVGPNNNYSILGN